nr:reverse transcriptase domain-containing protein [Tanacetum cinerariifolium]
MQIAGTLTDESLRNGSIKKNPEKKRNGGEPSRDRNVRDDNKRTRTENIFATTANYVRREYTGMAPKGCTYKEFLACNPKEYDGKEGAIVYTHWIEKMESIQDMSWCRDGQKVKYTASSFVGKALTWWNSQIHTRGREAVVGLSWEDFKTLTKEEFYPSNEMQNLETELWNHAMVMAGHAMYTDRFHELARLVPHLLTHKGKRIERKGTGGRANKGGGRTRGRSSNQGGGRIDGQDGQVGGQGSKVPLKGDVRTLIIDEAHKSKYFVHPGADKMYYDLRDSKIEAARNWKAPRTLSEKSKTIDWGEEQENVFQTLKDKLCNAPVLALPDGSQLKIHEKNYTTHNLELGTVVFALKI